MAITNSSRSTCRSFPPTGDKPDQIIADRAIYDQKSGILQFNGNVQIETHDALKVKTDSLQFNQDTKIAETSAPMTFERENVSGRSIGALVDNEKKRLELRSAVAVTVAPEAFKDAKNQRSEAVLKGARAKPVNIHSAQAVFEQSTMRLTFSGGATAEQDQDIMSGDTLTAILNDKKKLAEDRDARQFLSAFDGGGARRRSACGRHGFLSRRRSASAARLRLARHSRANSEC